MAEVSHAAELANFFMVAISIVFGVWYDKAEEVLSLKRPLAYAEREPYAKRIASTILGRCAPLCVAMGVFIMAFAPATAELLASYSFGVAKNIDTSATVYCILYWFLFYLFVVTVYQLYRLMKKLFESGEGRSAKQPRIRWL